MVKMENPTNFPIFLQFGQIWDYGDGTYSVWMTDDLEDESCGYSSRGKLTELWIEFKEEDEIMEQLYKISLVGKLVTLQGEVTKWKVMEDNGDRVLVQAIDTNLSIPPMEICNKKFITEIL